PPRDVPLQTSLLGQHWPPTHVDPAAQVPQVTVWPQLFVAVPQIWPVPQVGGPDGGQQVLPLGLGQTCPPLQQTWPHPQGVPVVRPTRQALMQVPPQQEPPEQQSAVVLQAAPMGLQAAWQVPPTQKPEQQSWVSVQAAPMGLQAAWQVPPTQKPEQQS